MSSEKKYNKIKGIIPSDDCLIKNWITIFERCSFFLFLSSVNFLKNTCPTDPAIIATGAWTMRHAKEKYPKINIPKYFPIKIFENALKFNPNDENLLFNMGLAQLQSGFLHHAELFFRKTLIENSNHFLANKNLAEIMLDQDNFIEAEYYFKKALMIDNNDSSVYESLSICLKNQSKLGEALQFAQFAFQAHCRWRPSESICRRRGDCRD